MKDTELDPKGGNAIALCDANAFYCSAERVMDPSLKGRPLAVASNNDGNLIARSAEAKALGIRMGDPLHKPPASDIIKRHGVAIRSSNYTLYADMQQRILAAMADCVGHDSIEVYSIDEAFCSLNGFRHLDLEQHCQDMRKRILEWTTIPTCVGVGPNKTLAKLANAVAKKNPLFDGVADLRDEQVRHYIMNRFEVADVWGVGSATARKLQGLGIETAAQLRDMPLRQARGLGTVVLERLVAELRGVVAHPMEYVAPERKGMACTGSFGQPVTDFETLMSAIAEHAMRAGEKLREHGMMAGRMIVFFHTNPHREDLPQASVSRTGTMQPITNDPFVMIDLARRLAKRGYREGYAYTKAGIVLENLAGEGERPLTLFEDPDMLAKRRRLIGAIDEVNAKFGRLTIVPASQGFERVWKRRADFKSPRWTTRIEELPVARAADIKHKLF